MNKSENRFVLRCFHRIRWHFSIISQLTRLPAAYRDLCGGVVFRAGFEAAEYTPSGPNATLVHVFSVIEHLLTLWLPLSIVAVIALLCLIRLVSLVRCAARS